MLVDVFAVSNRGRKGLTSESHADHDAVRAGYPLQPGALWMAVLEPDCADPWVVDWGETEEVVVWGE